jgi:hypothetical protein
MDGRMVLAAGGQGPAVGGERHGMDLVSMSTESLIRERFRLLLLRRRHEKGRRQEEAPQEGRQPQGHDRHPDRVARYPPGLIGVGEGGQGA